MLKKNTQYILQIVSINIWCPGADIHLLVYQYYICSTYVHSEGDR